MHIMIVKTPRGEAPEEIRQAWFGLILPCIGKFSEGHGHVIGALSKKLLSRNMAFFKVPEPETIDILTKTNQEAGTWWRKHGFPKNLEDFVFYEDEAIILPENEAKQDGWG